ncbi:MAG: hypothetical protein ACTSUE_01270 [Promethearchaeota archaeon]
MAPPTGFQPNTILILPFSELGTKSKKTREKMMVQLLTNVKHVLKNVFKIDYTKFRHYGERLVFQFRIPALKGALVALHHVPGILRLVPCTEGKSQLSSIKKRISRMIDEGIINDRYAVKEIKTLYFRDKKEANALKASLFEGADVPDMTREENAINIELHPEFSYISLANKSEFGLNGNPVGSQNPLLTEILGRPSDVVAALNVITRGVVITPVYHDLGVFLRDAPVSGRVIKLSKEVLDKYHGFPVKKEIHVRLGALLEYLFKSEPRFRNFPCATCIIARRVIALHLSRKLNMLPYIVEGTSIKHSTFTNESCPVALSLDSRYFIEKLALIQPEITGIDVFRDELMSNYYKKIQETAGCGGDQSTWNFCSIKAEAVPVPVQEGAGEDARMPYRHEVATHLHNNLDNFIRIQISGKQ